MVDTPTLIEQCNVPPKGWICQRGKGHAGPCAANPLPEGMTEGQYWYSRWWDAVADDEAAQAIATLTAELDMAVEALQEIGDCDHLHTSHTIALKALAAIGDE